MTNTTETTKRVNSRRKLQGVVKSNKMDKTIVVQTNFKYQHPNYNKVVIRYNKYKAHDEGNKAKVGDAVVIQECRPISKDKRWTLVSINGEKLS